MKYSQKGFLLPLVIILIAVVIGGGVYYYSQNTKKDLTFQKLTPTTATSTASKVVSVVATTTPKSTSLSVDKSLSCTNYDEYFLITRTNPINSEEIDFLIKHKLNKEDVIPCIYNAEKIDFKFTDSMYTSVIGFQKQLVLLDSGTGPTRVLAIIDMNSGKDVFDDTYNGSVIIKNNTAIYWSDPEDPKTPHIDCPSSPDLEYPDNVPQAYQALDLTTFKKTSVNGQVRCQQVD